jgi:hypothetical protein
MLPQYPDPWHAEMLLPQDLAPISIDKEVPTDKVLVARSTAPPMPTDSGYGSNENTPQSFGNFRAENFM